ncbi:solute carrier family 25 member 38 [Lentinula aciculospora]|uniref:Mitochondrial glycine transporter n=1 Tax=Lentinula aciculospora TaxID=153920 RepID=A0A9W9AT52_9AGAR|nr:solute carrier family 25 member 38 [Lentinula aciculospora]
MKNVGQQMTSGALSGLTSTIALQPFDLLKTRLQQGDSIYHGKFQPKQLAAHSVSVMKAAREVLDTSGMRGLWRGTAASLIRNVPGVALYMTGLTQLRSIMSSSRYFTVPVIPDHPSTTHSSVLPKLTNTGNLVAGATTRVGVGLLMNPLTLLKARFESNMYAYQTLSGAFASVVRSGPTELLRGLSAASLRDAPYAGIFVVFYEAMKRNAALITIPTSHTQSSLLHSGSAAAAGALATLATHPFDVVKTKLQVRTENQYHSFISTARTIWKYRGIRGYFDGTSLRLSRKVLSSAIGWAVYEFILMSVWTSQ